MKQFTSPTQQKGYQGEQIALKYLQKIGFSIIETNYTKRMGEIDIVAFHKGKLHFIEVKTLFYDQYDVSRETYGGKRYDPWQNVSREKLRRFGRTCEIYIIERNVSRETPWQIDVIAVSVTTQLDFSGGSVPRETRHAKVEALWNVVG